MNVGVVGAGSWGTALAIQLARSGDRVRLWDHRPERAARMQEQRENKRYMPGVSLVDNIEVSGELGHVLEDAALVVEVIPSQSVRRVAESFAPLVPAGATVLCASKGIEQG
ncbi:MAG: 2-dehydropantoate 2-reductase N-terminal domain-containing protein, partial [Myxococcota bacterium]|nr:2-dehydropantoate 2-reductase N-terminal domain-containing protein [Myxococcota bacterium]